MIKGRWIKNKKVLFWLFPGIVFFAVVYAGLIEPYQVVVSHVWVQSAGLKRVLEGKLAIHISDLHIEKIGWREKKVLKLIEELKPDIIFLTGDYVAPGGDYEPALNFLSKLKAKIGVWAVLGEYDYYSSSRKTCLFCHAPGSGKPTLQHKVHFLRNEMEMLSLQTGVVWVGGIDKEFNRPFSPELKLDFLGDRGPAIILSHSPLAFDLVNRDREILMLSGDTHGGQIPLLETLWRRLEYEKNARYNYGFFHNGRKSMYVSKGIGTSHFSFRFCRPPELVVLHF